MKTKFVLVINTLKDKVEKMICVIEIVKMLSMVFQCLVLIIVHVKTDILGIHGTLMLLITLLMKMVTVMLTVLTYSLNLCLIIPLMVLITIKVLLEIVLTWSTL
jgi:hypothetical protein